MRLNPSSFRSMTATGTGSPAGPLGGWAGEAETGPLLPSACGREVKWLESAGFLEDVPFWDGVDGSVGNPSAYSVPILLI